MKEKPNESVIHDWVTALPFTQQALLMLALRGPDGLPKYTTAKYIIHYLRGAILKPAYPDFKNKDGFMNIDYEQFPALVSSFFEDTDIYPMHFLMHIIHAAEVIGYNHPDDAIGSYWLAFYIRCCTAYHMNPETAKQLNKRLKF